MPIKRDFTDTVQTTNFTPFQLPPGTVLSENIDEMFSYDLQIPNERFEIDYIVGSDDTYPFELSLKNLTQNATLTVLVEYNKDIFVIRGEQFTLNPGQVQTVGVQLNTERLDVYSSRTVFDNEIKVSVTNVKNNSVIYKNTTENILEPKSLSPV